MAEFPESLLEWTRLLDESTASSSENETEEGSADPEGSLKTILDANESPARACRTEEMDWSDNLSGAEALISAGPTGMTDESTEKSPYHEYESLVSVSTESVQTDKRINMSQALPTEGPDMEGRTDIAPVMQTLQGRTGDAIGVDLGTGPSLPNEGPDQSSTRMEISVTQTSQGRTESSSIEDKAKPM